MTKVNEKLLHRHIGNQHTHCKSNSTQGLQVLSKHAESWTKQQRCKQRAKCAVPLYRSFYNKSPGAESTLSVKWARMWTRRFASAFFFFFLALLAVTIQTSSHTGHPEWIQRAAVTRPSSCWIRTLGNDWGSSVRCETHTRTRRHTHISCHVIQHNPPEAQRHSFKPVRAVRAVRSPQQQEESRRFQ